MATTVWLAPGAEAISEFARQSSGVFLRATCVETGALECAIGQDPVTWHLSPSQIGDYLQAMVKVWQGYADGVTSEGASSYVDATRWLRDLGYRVDENVIDANWWQTLQDGLKARQVFLVGVTNAQALPGDEPGVHNHGLTALGIDSDGNIICGDPDNWRSQVNMPGNPIGVFTTYSRQDFVNGQISSLTRVYPKMSTPLDGDFNKNGDSWSLKTNPKIVLSGGELALFIQVNAVCGLPTEETNYSLQHKYYKGFAFRRYERAIIVYDPQHKKDKQPGLGDFYFAHIDDPDFGLVSSPPPPDPKAKPAEETVAAYLAFVQAVGAYQAVK